MVFGTAAIGFYCRSNVLQTADCRKLLLTRGWMGCFASALMWGVASLTFAIANGTVKKEWIMEFQVIHMVGSS